MDIDLGQVRAEVIAVANGLLAETRLKAGNILVLGCTTSEICGERIGKASSAEVGEVVIDALQEVLKGTGIYLAVQCCEHLNRALVLEEAAAEKYGFEKVSVTPVLKAGGACATAAYARLKDSVVVESIRAHAGIDIGDTEIGMHVIHVQVPVRLESKTVGMARATCLKTRPKFIGGERAQYAHV